MGKRYRFFAVACSCILLVFGATTVRSQSFVVTRITSASYPAMTADCFAFDAAGKQTQIGAKAVTVNEDGTAVTATTGCSQDGPIIAASVVVATQTSTESLALIKAGAIAVNDQITGSTDELGLISFAQAPSLQQGLTIDRSKYVDRVNALKKGSGVSLDSLFQNAPLGAFAQLKNARNSRVLLLFVDGAAFFDFNAALKTLKLYNIRLYVVGVNVPITGQLRALCDSTGGLWVDALTKEADVKAYAWAYALTARRVSACVTNWTSAPNCETSRSYDFTYESITRSKTIPAPTGSRIVLEFSEPGLAFGEIAPPATATKSVVLTARNGKAKITSITSTNSHFTVVKPSGTVDLDPGVSQEVTVQFTPTDSSGQFGKIVFASAEACDSTILYVRGGFRAKDNNLRILSPNGGETLTAGLDTVITWTGTLPQDLVRIDASSDDGASWKSVTESGSGNSYRWTPNLQPTTKARVRIQQTQIDPSNIKVLSGSTKPIYSCVFSTDGTQAFTGGHDGTVRVWDVATGAQLKVMTGHSDWVWGLAAHPKLNVVASASHDGTVRFWNPATGNQIGAVPVPGRAWSLDFNANGDTLYVATDAGVSIIDPLAFTYLSSVVSSATPVYSVRVSANGTQLVCAEGNTVVLRSAVGDLAVQRTFTGHEGPVYAADLSPDGQVVASGGADLIVRRWDANTGTQTGQGKELTGSVLSVEFNTGGGQILIGSGDGTAKFYETSTMNELNSLAGHEGLIYCARYNSAGDKVVTASTDFTARIWNVVGIRLAEDKSDATFTIVGTASSITNVVFTPDVEIGSGVMKTQTVLTNTGSTTISITGVKLSSGNTADFNVVSPSAPVLLPPGGKYPLTVTFAPTFVGARNAALSVITGSGEQRVTLSGTGINPILNVVSTIDFGRRVANTARIDTAFRVALPNGATETVNVTKTEIVGTGASQFSILTGVAPYSVSTSNSASMTIRFAPTENGRAAADLVITASNGRVAVVHLYGEGTGDARIANVPPVVFSIDPCSSDPVPETFSISNVGNSTLVLYSGIIDGTDAAEFSLERVGAPLNFPIEVPSGQDVKFRVTFAPKTIGAKSARAVFTSNAINATSGLTAITLVARKDSAGFELSRETVIFSDVAQNDKPVETIYLINNGSLTLRWPSTPIDLGAFVIESITPDIMPAGKKSAMTIRFKGGTEGNVYRASYDVTTIDTVCGRKATLNLVAFVNAVVSVTLRTDTLHANTGATVSVPVYVTNKLHLDRTQVTSIHANVLVNASILQPTGSTPMGSLDSSGKIRSIPVVINIPPGQDSLGATLQFSTTWGNDTLSTITFKNFTQIDSMRVLVRDGAVILDDLCKQGGPRLFQIQPNAAGIVASPQPAQGPTVIDVSIVEKGQTTVELVDVTGHTIATLVQRNLAPGTYRVPVNASTLSAGTYFLMMTTPTERLSTRFDIAK